MKKFISILFVIAIIFSFTSCSFTQTATTDVQSEVDVAQSTETVEQESEEQAVTTPENSEENIAEETQDTTQESGSDAPELVVFHDLIATLDATNGDFKQVIGSDYGDAFITIYWGGTPSVAYDLSGMGDYMTLFLEGQDDMFDVMSNAGGLEATENIWPDNYEVSMMALTGAASYTLFNTDAEVTYNMLKANFADFPDLQFSVPDEVLDFSVPYVTYVVGDKKLELEFEQVGEEYVLSIALIADADSHFNTLSLRI